jgi:hypothetical protein
MRWFLYVVFNFSLLDSLVSQSFELEQFAQLYRPRLRLDALYQHPITLKNEKLNSKFDYSAQHYQAHVSVPIAGKLSIGAELDFTQPNFKDLIKNSLKIKAWQLMLNARLGYRTSHLDKLSAGGSIESEAYLGSIGLSGVKLTKRFNIMFYSLNVNFAEELKSFKNYQFRGNATLGWAKFKGNLKYFIYGFHFNVSDRLALPIPFIGGRIKLFKRLNLNYVLPVQANLQYVQEKKWSYFLGLRPEGQRWGWNNKVSRGSYSYLTLSPYLASRYAPNRNSQFRLEVAYNAYSRFRIVNEGIDNSNFNGKQSFFIQITFIQLFGKSLIDQVMSRF